MRLWFSERLKHENGQKLCNRRDSTWMVLIFSAELFRLFVVVVADEFQCVTLNYSHWWDLLHALVLWTWRSVGRSILVSVSTRSCSITVISKTEISSSLLNIEANGDESNRTNSLCRSFQSVVGMWASCGRSCAKNKRHPHAHLRFVSRRKDWPDSQKAINLLPLDRTPTNIR